jgi:hypothetical protein
MDVSAILEIGESMGSSGSTARHSQPLLDSFEDSSEDEDDWEEVFDGTQQVNGSIPPEGVVVHIPGEGYELGRKKGTFDFITAPVPF